MTEETFNRLNDNILTREQVAKLLKRSEHTILNWGREGKLKEHRLFDRNVYYYLDEVMKNMS